MRNNAYVSFFLRFVNSEYTVMLFNARSLVMSRGINAINSSFSQILQRSHEKCGPLAAATATFFFLRTLPERNLPFTSGYVHVYAFTLYMQDTALLTADDRSDVAFSPAVVFVLGALPYFK